jgi:hypothetical protein
MGVWSELFRGAPTGSIVSELSKGLNTISIRIYAGRWMLTLRVERVDIGPVELTALGILAISGYANSL